jgi:hypothetical protein
VRPSEHGQQGSIKFPAPQTPDDMGSDKVNFSGGKAAAVKWRGETEQTPPASLQNFSTWTQVCAAPRLVINVSKVRGDIPPQGQRYFSSLGHSQQQIEKILSIR